MPLKGAWYTATAMGGIRHCRAEQAAANYSRQTSLSTKPTLPNHSQTVLVSESRISDLIRLSGETIGTRFVLVIAFPRPGRFSVELPKQEGLYRLEAIDPAAFISTAKLQGRP
jgi:hypothetical protein